MTTTLGVVLFGVLEGILIAVGLSILGFFKRNWWPTGQVLGRVASLDAWRTIEAYPDAAQTPGVVVFRWEAPLFFANASVFRQEIHQLVNRFDAHWVVVQCEAITDIDVTAADMLERLDRELNQHGVHLVFVELRNRLYELLTRYGLLETLDQRHFYDSLDEALTSIDTMARSR
jgi:MFS superfamily sulfate permease-like transporter